MKIVTICEKPNREIGYVIASKIRIRSGALLQNLLKYSKQVRKLLEKVVNIAIQMQAREVHLKSGDIYRVMGIIGISASKNSLEVFIARKNSMITVEIITADNAEEIRISRRFRPLPAESKTTADSRRFIEE